MPYLRLLHGRAEPDARPGSRGVDGPIFGPFPRFHRCGREIRLDECAGYVLRMHDGDVFYGGVYYGDWSVFAGPPTASEREFLVEFAPDLAQPPRRNGQNGAACASIAVSDSKQLRGCVRWPPGRGQRPRLLRSPGSAVIEAARFFDLAVATAHHKNADGRILIKPARVRRTE